MGALRTATSLSANCLPLNLALLFLRVEFLCSLQRRIYKPPSQKPSSLGARFYTTLVVVHISMRLRVNFARERRLGDFFWREQPFRCIVSNQLSSSSGRIVFSHL